MILSKKLKVRTIGDPALKRQSEPVKEIDQKIIDFANQMLRTMYAYDGIGLAAPQVGVNLRLVVLHVPEPKVADGQLPPLPSPGEAYLLPKMPVALINPAIISVGGESLRAEEGCLSVPDIYAQVLRPSRVQLRTTLVDGETVQIECGNWLARALQHEIDHLDGVLFVDRLDDQERKRIKTKLDRLTRKSKSGGFIRRLVKNESHKEELF